MVENGRQLTYLAVKVGLSYLFYVILIIKYIFNITFTNILLFFPEVYCGPVPQIDNGFSIGSTNVTYRGIATYQCYAGFAFPTGQPIERISCLSDGRWERTPTCLGTYYG